MPDPDKPVDNQILTDAVAEIKAMAKEGAAHPSTKPVVIGGAVGRESFTWLSSWAQKGQRNYGRIRL